MIHFFKPLPPIDIDATTYKPFIKNEWFRTNFMKFVYALQLTLIFLSIILGVWKNFSWLETLLIFVATFLCHELLHIVVVYKIGDISLTHSGIFVWLDSDARMSKGRFWLFMTLPILGLTVVPLVIMPLVKNSLGFWLMGVAWANAIIAGADSINSVLIAIKPATAKFYRGYYQVENTEK